MPALDVMVWSACTSSQCEQRSAAMIIISLIDNSFTVQVLAAKIQETLGGGEHGGQ
jgi:hypothetical protein